jgi:hypothetical protein
MKYSTHMRSNPVPQKKKTNKPVLAHVMVSLLPLLSTPCHGAHRAGSDKSVRA